MFQIMSPLLPLVTTQLIAHFRKPWFKTFNLMIYITIKIRLENLNFRVEKN